MYKVALLAFNEGCEEQEKWLQSYLAEKFAIHKEVDLLILQDVVIDKVIDQVEKEADRTILVFDAVRGMNSMFAEIASKLCRIGIKPILLITNSDNELADIKSADNALSEIWSHENQKLETWQLKQETLYFSYEKQAIDNVPEIKENKFNLNFLVNLIV